MIDIDKIGSDIRCKESMYYSISSINGEILSISKSLTKALEYEENTELIGEHHTLLKNDLTCDILFFQTLKDQFKTSDEPYIITLKYLTKFKILSILKRDFYQLEMKCHKKLTGI